MAQLVRHHASDFVVGARRLQHAAVQEHRSAGERKCVDLPQVDDVERVAESRLLESRRNGGDEPAPIRSTSASVGSSFSIGSCWRTSPAALRPSWTSCAGVKLLRCGSIRVCAESTPAVSVTRTKTMVERMFRVMRGGCASPGPVKSLGNQRLFWMGCALSWTEERQRRQLRQRRVFTARWWRRTEKR